MPNIENLEKNNLKQSGIYSETRNYHNPILNVRRGEIFFREDIKMTFAYAVLGVSALAILASIGYLGIKQLQK